MGFAERLPNSFYERRDLVVTTDFRDLLASVPRHHADTPDLARIFPGYEVKPLHYFRPTT